MSEFCIKQALSSEQFRLTKRLMVLMGPEREFLNQYRAAWEEFVRRTNALQDCLMASEPDRAGVEVALLAAEKARLAYNAARDLLVAQMARPQPAQNPAAPPALPQDGKVRAIARLLWEFAGKPDGTALADWLKAERLVQSAYAALAQQPVGPHRFAPVSRAAFLLVPDADDLFGFDAAQGSSNHLHEVSPPAAPG
jgi:hypothetical protein